MIDSATPIPSTDASPIPAAPNRHLPTLHHHLVTANHPAAQFGTTALVSRSPPNTSPRTGHRESRKPSTSPNDSDNLLQFPNTSRNRFSRHFTSEQFTRFQPKKRGIHRTPHRHTARKKRRFPNTSPTYSLKFFAQDRTPHRHTAKSRSEFRTPHRHTASTSRAFRTPHRHTANADYHVSNFERSPISISISKPMRRR